MSWTSRLARFKTAYDSPEILEGAALEFADAAYSGYADTGVPETEFTPSARPRVVTASRPWCWTTKCGAA